MPEVVEAKKQEAPPKRDISLFNRGPRTFDLGFDPGANGKPTPRRHTPGTSHNYTAEEAVKMSAYKELVDLSKLPGQLDARAMKDENAKLLAENKALKEQLAGLAPKEDPKPDTKAKGK